MRRAGVCSSHVELCVVRPNIWSSIGRPLGKKTNKRKGTICAKPDADRSIRQGKNHLSDHLSNQRKTFGTSSRKHEQRKSSLIQQRIKPSKWRAVDNQFINGTKRALLYWLFSRVPMPFCFTHFIKSVPGKIAACPQAKWKKHISGARRTINRCIDLPLCAKLPIQQDPWCITAYPPKSRV